MKQIFEDLSKRLHNLIDRYETFLGDPNNESNRSNALFGVTEILNKEKESFELKVGSKRFLVKGDIKLSSKMVYLQTFEIIPNWDFYPNEKLKPISELDIAISIYGNRFVRKIEAIPNSFLTDPTLIKEFNTQYTDQLWYVIQRLEKSETPEMDKI